MESQLIQKERNVFRYFTILGLISFALFIYTWWNNPKRSAPWLNGIMQVHVQKQLDTCYLTKGNQLIKFQGDTIQEGMVIAQLKHAMPYSDCFNLLESIQNAKKPEELERILNQRFDSPSLNQLIQMQRDQLQSLMQSTKQITSKRKNYKKQSTAVQEKFNISQLQSQWKSCIQQLQEAQEKYSRYEITLEQLRSLIRQCESYKLTLDQAVTMEEQNSKTIQKIESPGISTQSQKQISPKARTEFQSQLIEEMNKYIEEHYTITKQSGVFQSSGQSELGYYILLQSLSTEDHERNKNISYQLRATGLEEMNPSVPGTIEIKIPGDTMHVWKTNHMIANLQWQLQPHAQFHFKKDTVFSVQFRFR